MLFLPSPRSMALIFWLTMSAMCRRRLFDVFDADYTRLFKLPAKNECREAVRFILERNIIWGDALTLEDGGREPQPIVFSEWSPVNGSMLKRRDFTFHDCFA